MRCPHCNSDMEKRYVVYDYNKFMTDEEKAIMHPFKTHPMWLFSCNRCSYKEVEPAGDIVAE